MTPKKRSPKAITTDATKHKLPLPKGHPQQRPKRKRPAGSAPKIAPPRAIPCGEDWWNTPTTPKPEGDGWTWSAFEGAWRKDIPILYGDDILIPPPDTNAYPWAVVLGGIGADNLVAIADWCRALPTRFRLWLAVRLTRLAGWVTP